MIHRIIGLPLRGNRLLTPSSVACGDTFSRKGRRGLAPLFWPCIVGRVELMRVVSLLLFVLIALGGCQSRHDCVVTPNDTVECS